MRNKTNLWCNPQRRERTPPPKPEGRQPPLGEEGQEAVPKGVKATVKP